MEIFALGDRRLLYKEGPMVEFRKEAGVWLRQIREQRGISQRVLAEKVGLDYYTFISQIESGRGRIPSERYQHWADALGVNPVLFVKTMLRFYEPTTFAILFGGEAPLDQDHADAGTPSVAKIVAQRP
jgi:transcriptional regulator with XRE-family HTH domain